MIYDFIEQECRRNPRQSRNCSQQPRFDREYRTHKDLLLIVVSCAANSSLVEPSVLIHIAPRPHRPPVGIDAGTRCFDVTARPVRIDAAHRIPRRHCAACLCDPAVARSVVASYILALGKTLDSYIPLRPEWKYPRSDVITINDTDIALRAFRTKEPIRMSFEFIS